MKNIKDKLDIKHKLIFIFLLALGNALMGLSLFGEEPQVQLKGSQNIPSENYVSIIIKGKLKTNPSPYKQVSLISLRSKVKVPNAFFLKALKKELGPESFIEKDLTNEYLILVHESFASIALSEESFLIYPSGVELKTNRRKSYEVNY